MRALMVAIARGEAPISLGAKARQALGRILDLTGNPALLSITSLAEVLGVNPSTLTRLAHSLGYSGFPAFQQVLLTASMAPPGEFYSRQARAALAEGTSTRSRAIQLCHENQANIDRFVEQFDRDAFEAAVDLIMSAPRVAVYGIRQFHAVAAFLVYGLRMIRADVALLDANSLGIAEGLAMLEKGDVLLVASCAPYSAQVVEVARTAREIGLASVALTDRASSPLVDSSRAAILVAHESSFISNSIGAFTVAAECLINACAAARPDQTRKALLERDRMIERLAIEL
ncbi:MurR/RpiR family transcriptional regulator [Albidovulum sp.]|uniref:MurR/RpiR family transcriptional regulator n=1 Tax=Albidovulum sp. TaxID=1872424 RepID=UPI0025C409FB|nr:MurR/RpiR family transcriptional regulator [Defluviimonas sp.]